MYFFLVLKGINTFSWLTMSRLQLHEAYLKLENKDQFCDEMNSLRHRHPSSQTVVRIHSAKKAQLHKQITATWVGDCVTSARHCWFQFVCFLKKLFKHETNANLTISLARCGVCIHAVRISVSSEKWPAAGDEPGPDERLRSGAVVIMKILSHS